ncbi:flagellar basal-body rod protein FlgG [Acetoanaerobium pronyense]|uniref:Flagellar basal-body rod protein FlgG n=1 Tax=Acetoanaerobium pronyense TaxID=1482736 RepID=A0ABS4KHH7_9FIRM|nr:flagellar basal-body rod protein FlgG [Acetoanaerobium pronyense]MBP2027242.1 flagellar basal-body rod protein FlgG [Acetoanaerobium pronyense]
MRTLWTAASGMKAQQLNMDTISNNLANVNTTAFKKQKVEFKDLLYTSMKSVSNVPEQGEPVNLQIGHGVRPVATSRYFMNGNLEKTENPTDVGLEGPGFFVIENPAGNPEFLYTRDGNFKFAVDGDVMTLVTSNGYSVMSTDEDIIEIDGDMSDFSVSETGLVTATDLDGEIVELGQIQVVNFINPEGLQAVGGNFYTATVNSGEGVMEEGEDVRTKMYQGYLETSNVQLVDEMVRMIMAQRAYEINSKSIQTADDMLQTVNQLKR